MSELRSIAFKITSRAEMQTREIADISVDRGIKGDFRGTPGRSPGHSTQRVLLAEGL